MKKLSTFQSLTLNLFPLILTLCLLFGCGEEAEDKLGEVAVSGEYTGFLQLKGGEWVEYNLLEGGRTRYEYIGTDTYKGVKCSILEFETVYGGQKTISQIWLDLEKGEAVLYVMKVSGKVMKLEPQGPPEGVSIETPPEYEPGKQIGIETYTTPTGKKVKAAIFEVASGETWVSAEVPFGVVKSITNGEVVLELYDFAFSGAKRDISKEEAENAESLLDFPDIP